MTNIILQYVFLGLSVIAAAWGYWRRPKRTALWATAICAGGAAASAHFDAFWPMATLATLGLFAFILSLDVIDLGWRARFALIVGVCSFAFIVFWPSLETLTGGLIPCPSYVKTRMAARLVAGLDLRGGMRLVYTVDVDEAIKDKRSRFYEDMRNELSRLYGVHEGDDRPSEQELEKLRQLVEVQAPRSESDTVVIQVKPGADPSKIDTRFLVNWAGDMSYSRSGDQRKLTFRLRETAKSAIRDRAVGQAREIILRRVDALGLREAAVSTRDEDIIIEVPGESEKQFDTIREIVSQTARLEFKLLDDGNPYMKELADNSKAASQSLPAGLEFHTENAPDGLDSNGDPKSISNTYAYLPIAEKETAQQTLDRLKAWAETLSLPPDRELGYELQHERDEATLKEKETGWRTFLLKSRADITGDMIRDAAAQPNQDSGSLGGWHVALTFTDQGGKIFERITGANIKRRFAIILDDRTESAPVIQTRIPGGHAQITMGSGDPQAQLEDSKKLELVLRSGALPAPISPSNEQRIGPSLGRDSIKSGVEGALGGALIVVIFMMIYYKGGGLIADISVLMNLFLQLSILTSLGASMTLPGIAGLALTIGMGVDCNVLINERIREELREGKSPRAAVEVGFDRAFTAIIDGHLTTLISGVVLAQYGTGPIKGFAVTLIVGVAASIFTGLVVSRVMFDLWVRGIKDRTATLDIG
ncbi:MAG: protein translocase subunit SecD [Polyangiaceae bacterium]|nr:protein translocase subunit SecD [Polyangiaceae bacterium]